MIHQLNETVMTNKSTKGYTKSTIGKLDLFKLLTKDVYKDPNEPFEKWFERKILEQFKDISGGMDEQGTSRKGSAQSSKPLL